MKNLVLIGFMGTGKTEIGRLLAKRLGYTFVDCDVEIERRAKMTIPQIFQEWGEPRFREMEAAVIKEVAEGRDLVIATGGGAVLREENMLSLKRRGIIVCLMATPETVARRTEGNRERPLLEVVDRMVEIRRLLGERMPYYEKAEIIVDTDEKTPGQIVDEIFERAGSLLKNA